MAMQTSHRFLTLDNKALKLSRVAATVAIVLMGLAIYTSQVSLANANEERAKVIAGRQEVLRQVASLKSELQSVRRDAQEAQAHCAMEMESLHAQIAQLKRK